MNKLTQEEIDEKIKLNSALQEAQWEIQEAFTLRQGWVNKHIAQKIIDSIKRALLWVQDVIDDN